MYGYRDALEPPFYSQCTASGHTWCFPFDTFRPGAIVVFLVVLPTAYAFFTGSDYKFFCNARFLLLNGPIALYQ